MSAITTKVELHKDESRSVYHERRAPADPRRPLETHNRVTHAWTHPDTKADRAACAACKDGVLPKEVR